MLLQEKVDNLRKSRIIRLNWEGGTVGLRVSLFNLDTDIFEHFDFNIKFVKDMEVRKFLTAREFEIVNLVEHGGVLMTPDEISGAISVKEFESEADAIRILRPIMRLYEHEGR